MTGNREKAIVSGISKWRKRQEKAPLVSRAGAMTFAAESEKWCFRLGGRPETESQSAPQK